MELREGFTVERKPNGVTEISKDGRVLLFTVFGSEQAMLNVLLNMGAIPR